MPQSNAQTPAPAKPPQRPQRSPVPAVPPEFQADAIMKMDSAGLVKLLKDPASSRFQKSKACMQLAVVGGKDAVAPLAAMLSDPEMAHYARFALVPLPDPSVDDALRAALPNLTGLLRINVIDAMGSRRDGKSVEVLKPIAYGTDEEAAKAALGALGMIGTTSAAAALQEGLSKTQDPIRKEVAAACLVCAETMLRNGDRKQALEIYARLSQTDIPKPVRLGAMNSIILAETSPSRPK